ncbi:MAG: hypothetical protein ABIQ49_08315 [Gemmatimonadales bacterium]
MFAAPAAAQETAEIATPADLHKEPEGAPLVTLPAGAPVETGRAEGRWNEATVEGWIYGPSTERTRRDGFDLVVTPGDGENLRSEPNGPVVGRAREGTLLERVSQKGRWVQVRRNGWIPRKAIAAPAGAAPATGKPQSPAPASNKAASLGIAAAPVQAQGEQPAPATRGTTAGAGGPADSTRRTPERAPDGVERAQIARDAPLAAAPEGGLLGTVRRGVPARIVARSGELVKVQVEGWLPADAIAPTDGGAMVGVTAAEVRAEPDRFVGRTVEWRLQVIAVKVADELRSELPPGQPYLLTRGPLPEPGFVYVGLPAARVAEFQALPPLQELVLRVSIRAARTKFLATPVVELVSIVSGADGK